MPLMDKNFNNLIHIQTEIHTGIRNSDGVLMQIADWWRCKMAGIDVGAAIIIIDRIDLEIQYHN